MLHGPKCHPAGHTPLTQCLFLPLFAEHEVDKTSFKEGNAAAKMLLVAACCGDGDGDVQLPFVSGGNLRWVARGCMPFFFHSTMCQFIWAAMFNYMLFLLTCVEMDPPACVLTYATCETK